MSGPARTAERPTELRLARLHLRGGTYALARAELEALAGADGLDRDAILDLAEVRWRTGDVAGAGAAVDAWLEDAAVGDPGAVLAHVIAAEAAAQAGAVGEAAGHVDAAAAGLGGPADLDLLLAGIGPRAVWPWETGAATAEPPIPGGARADVTGPAGESATGDEAGLAHAPEGEPTGAAGIAVGGAALAAAADLAATPSGLGRPGLAPAAANLVTSGAPLVATAPDRAAILLALALRADGAAAEAVLDALDAVPAAGVAPDAGEAPAHASALAFVRAEALRAAGRHEEARIAYASAERLALGSAALAGPPAEPGIPPGPTSPPAEPGTPRSST